MGTLIWQNAIRLLSEFWAVSELFQNSCIRIISCKIHGNNTVIHRSTASLYIGYVSRTRITSENRNLRYLYWLEIPKGTNVPIKWMEMLFISDVPSVVIISVVTRVVIVSRTHHRGVFTSETMREKREARRNKKEKDLERAGEVQKGWRDSLIDRRGSRKGQKPLGGGTFPQKKLHGGTFSTHTDTHTKAFASWWCGIWMPLGGSSHMHRKCSALR